jgi:protein-disulfide isomerase
MLGETLCILSSAGPVPDPHTNNQGASHVFASKTQIGRSVLSRRSLLQAMSLSAIGLSAGLVPRVSLAQSRGADEVPVDVLMQPGKLDELTLGQPDAKVTVVEYASMSCTHCAHFANDVWPEFKKKYVDTGKVYYVFREFPLDNRAMAAAMLARCAGGDKTFPLIEVLFEKQADWAFIEGSPVPKLFELAKQAGFTQESFDKCLTDQALLDKITAERERGSEVFGVAATPTFFINGKRLKDSPTMASFDKMIEPLLTKS